MTSILEVKDLFFSYGNEDIIKGANLSLKRGDFSALIGSNGAGKTTLIKLLLGILSPDKGQVLWDGKPLEKGTDFSQISYVPQLMAGVDHFPISVEELVSLNLYKELRGLKILDDSHKKRILDALTLVGMQDQVKELYQNLSGGQRQRVLIAKALISLPQVLLLDEPTTGIDSQAKGALFDLLFHLNQSHDITILMITHELQAVEKIIDSVYLLEDGRIQRRRIYG